MVEGAVDQNPSPPIGRRDSASSLRVRAAVQSGSDICPSPETSGCPSVSPPLLCDRPGALASSHSHYLTFQCFQSPHSRPLQPFAMTALQLLFLAVSATSVLAEPTVYLREQFEDGGESFSPHDSLPAEPRGDGFACMHRRNVHMTMTDVTGHCALCGMVAPLSTVGYWNIALCACLSLIKCFT